MKVYPIKSTTLLGLAALPLLVGSFLLAQDEEEELFLLSPFSIGATPGGAQDLNYARSQVDVGRIPHPNTFQAEGLLSEYDLPLKGRRVLNGSLVSVHGEAMPARLLRLPEASHIAQIGFASGVDPEAWQRDRLNLVAVVDKSGSMSRLLPLVKDSLRAAVDQLDEGDQLSIVLYGERSYVHLKPTRLDEAGLGAIEKAIGEIVSGGSTNMEAGLEVGYSLAEYAAESFEGATRLMLFTDERPNTGDTSEEGFMGQMRRGSKKGIGLTTIGVGLHFGAELANKLSSVRGGNLFYFSDENTMADKFEAEFDTFVTELAFDLKMTIEPTRGYEIAGVYGIPGDLLQWEEDGHSISMKIETLFLSLRKGAIYFALSPKSSSDLPKRVVGARAPVAKVSLKYQDAASGEWMEDKFDFRSGKRGAASAGLLRGEALVNQYISLKKATTAHHHENDQEKAYQIASELSQYLQGHGDEALQGEVEFVSKMVRRLAELSGNGYEFDEEEWMKPADLDPISGLPKRS